MPRIPAVCVGAVAPAAMTYARLQRLLGDRVAFVLKDPECFIGALPAGYTLATELAAVLAAADAAGFERFHLVGYSAGGSLALALALAHPERLLSLTLVEPAWIGRPDWSAAEAEFVAAVDAVMRLPVAARGPGLLRAMADPDGDLAAAVPDPLPAWLVDRPARFAALWQAFHHGAAAFVATRPLAAPIVLPVGGRSHPRFLAAARRLQAVHPHAAIDRYDDCTHLDPPQTRAPERFAERMRALWSV